MGLKGYFLTQKYMQIKIKQTLTLLILSIFFVSCSGDDNPIIPDDDTPIEVSPVVFDLNAVPYPKLSDYNFFKSPMQNMEPVYGVLPFQPASQLFTDYAEKKRFLWMPEGVSATFQGDDKILNFPVGAVLIKNFYYKNVLPSHTQKIIETRLMIRKAEGWIFANYVWNDEQTEALHTSNGGVVPITWMHNGVEKSIEYRIPNDGQCFMCHYLNNQNMPLGPKPQNMNFPINFADGSINQLEKFKNFGYLNGEIPTSISSTVDYNDTSKSLDLRARSYLDMNCGSCHRTGGYAEFYPVRFNYTPDANYDQLGFCLEPNINIHGLDPNSIGADHIIYASDFTKSIIYYRMNTEQENIKMPMIGRSIIHNEGVQLISNWINSFPEQNCD